MTEKPRELSLQGAIGLRTNEAGGILSGPCASLTLEEAGIHVSMPAIAWRSAASEEYRRTLVDDTGVPVPRVPSTIPWAWTG